MYSFNKEERLCSRKNLDLLFKNGSSFLLYPYRISYLFLNNEAKFPAQVVINVPKKRYKRAVDRNLLKRRIKESYRLNKQESLYANLSIDRGLLLLSVQFVGKEKYEYNFLAKKMLVAFKRLFTLIATDATY